MSDKPAIISVDDDPQVLATVKRDLRRRYAADYRVVSAPSGKDALEALHERKRRGDDVALLLVDQRMPEMSGTELLEQAGRLYPDAMKVLLTAYADTQAAITSINDIGLDHYLMKPWDPPEEHLYPVLDELLEDWVATAGPVLQDIQVAGAAWDRLSYETKDFLAHNHVRYSYRDIETEPDARAMVEEATRGEVVLPVVFLGDGSFLVQPSQRELAERIGLATTASGSFYDLIIVGAGPAGLGAAVYGASEGLKTLLVDRAGTGGQAALSSRIENYLGFPDGVSGGRLAEKATRQAQRLGAEILTVTTADSVRLEDPYRVVVLEDGTELRCKALLVATGMSLRMLDGPGFDEFLGRGVYYGAATTEAMTYKDDHVVVIGGANSAGQAAVKLSQYAGRVSVAVRGPSIAQGMSDYLCRQIAATPNIEVWTDTEVVEVRGSSGPRGRVEHLSLRDTDTGEVRSVDAGAVFIFIGASPHSGVVADLVERDRAGFILTGADFVHEGRRPVGWRLPRDPFLLETSVPGIFAAGDVTRDAVRRCASAVGSGAIAVTLVHQYLTTV